MLGPNFAITMGPPAGFRGGMSTGFFGIGQGPGGFIDWARISKGLVKFPFPGSEIDRRDRPTRPTRPTVLPVGKTDPAGGSVFQPGPVFSPIRKPVGQVSQKIPTEIIRTEPPSYPRTLPTIPPTLPRLPTQILNPPIFPEPDPRVGSWEEAPGNWQDRKPLQIKEVPVALDLGNVALGIGGLYKDYLLAKNQPVYDIQGLNPWSNVPLNQYDMPGVVDPVAGGTCLPAGYAYDKNGCVVRKRRRRRRRLATGSDIKDLAALSAVTTGAEKKTWIATHPT